MRILFVTWDGPEVNYLESLFLPIFAALQDKGVLVDILQFRWGDTEIAAATEAECDKAGVGYRSVTIHRRPSAIGPFASALLGSREVRRAARDFRSDIVMPRSLMPALTVLAAGGRRLRPVLFDADGLEADERTEFRQLPKSSPIYLVLRAVERRMVREADAVLVRTSAAADVLSQRAHVPPRKFHLFANGRDPDRYEPAPADERARIRKELGISDTDPVIAYIGSVGGKYRLRQVAKLTRAVRQIRPDAKLLVLTAAADEARRMLAAEDPQVADSALTRRVRPDEVSSYLSVADIGTSFIKPSFSMRAAAPVKLGEYLLCGVPIIGTAAVGHTAPAIEAGVFLDEAAVPDEAARWVVDVVLPNRDRMRSDARAVGLDHFSLHRSVEDYLCAIAAMQPSCLPDAATGPR